MVAKGVTTAPSRLQPTSAGLQHVHGHMCDKAVRRPSLPKGENSKKTGSKEAGYQYSLLLHPP